MYKSYDSTWKIQVSCNTPGVGDGQGGLACWGSLGCRVRHDWATELNWGVTLDTNFHIATTWNWTPPTSCRLGMSWAPAPAHVTHLGYITGYFTFYKKQNLNTLTWHTKSSNSYASSGQPFWNHPLPDGLPHLLMPISNWPHTAYHDKMYAVLQTHHDLWFPSFHNAVPSIWNVFEHLETPTHPSKKRQVLMGWQAHVLCLG